MHNNEVSIGTRAWLVINSDLQLNSCHHWYVKSKAILPKLKCWTTITYRLKPMHSLRCWLGVLIHCMESWKPYSGLGAPLSCSRSQQAREPRSQHRHPRQRLAWCWHTHPPSQHNTDPNANQNPSMAISFMLKESQLRRFQRWDITGFTTVRMSFTHDLACLQHSDN